MVRAFLFSQSMQCFLPALRAFLGHGERGSACSYFPSEDVQTTLSLWLFTCWRLACGCGQSISRGSLHVLAFFWHFTVNFVVFWSPKPARLALLGFLLKKTGPYPELGAWPELCAQDHFSIISVSCLLPMLALRPGHTRLRYSFVFKIDATGLNCCICQF